MPQRSGPGGSNPAVQARGRDGMVQVVASALGETVNTKTHYTLYHPKWYRPQISVWWWLKTWSYTKFVLRELTSLSVAYFALVTLWQVSSLARGPEAYLRLLE